MTLLRHSKSPKTGYLVGGRGGGKLRKWMANDKALRDLNDEAETKSTEAGSVTNEEETYAKFTLASEANKSLPKVLGVPWDYEKDSIHFSFEKVVQKALENRPTKRILVAYCPAC